MHNISFIYIWIIAIISLFSTFCRAQNNTVGGDKSQYVVFQIQPSGNPIIMLDGENLEVVGGTAMKRKKFGTYEYRVDMDGYHSEIGEITVNDPQNKHLISITMRPAFGAIEIPETKELAGASVFLDNKLEGTVPLTINKVASGQHSIRIVKPLYSPFEQTVTVKDGETTTVKASLSSNASNVTLNVDGNAEIWVNGERKGLGSWTGTLEHGTYQIETRKTSHQTQSEVYTISEDIKIELNAPIPIYGSLNISVLPDGADIFIDGKKVGDTPMFLQEVLIGSHTINLHKTGYADLNKTIDVKEGQTANIEGNMTNYSMDSSNVDEKKNSSDNRDFSFGHMLKFTANGVSFTMVPVEGGTFQMGATSEQKKTQKNEKPVHSVTLSSYYIGQTEVTQALWKAVMGSNPSVWKGDKLPVETVSWNDCQTFIAKLNTQLADQLPEGKVFRLPTEAEWEFAARGGTQSKGYTYSGSKKLADVAWYADNCKIEGISKAHAVAKKSPNELDIYDMSGNVSEWCQDWFGDYSSETQTNPKGPGSGSLRVCRGGSWSRYDSARDCRTASRCYCAPTWASLFLGLRLALSE